MIVGYLRIFHFGTLLTCSGVSVHYEEIGRSFLSNPEKRVDLKIRFIEIFLDILPGIILSAVIHGALSRRHLRPVFREVTAKHCHLN